MPDHQILKKSDQALVDLDIDSSSLIVPYRGVKFGPDGQNEKTRGILMQFKMVNTAQSILLS